MRTWPRVFTRTSVPVYAGMSVFISILQLIHFFCKHWRPSAEHPDYASSTYSVTPVYRVLTMLVIQRPTWIIHQGNNGCLPPKLKPFHDITRYSFADINPDYRQVLNKQRIPDRFVFKLLLNTSTPPIQPASQPATVTVEHHSNEHIANKTFFLLRPESGSSWFEIFLYSAWLRKVINEHLTNPNMFR